MEKVLPTILLAGADKETHDEFANILKGGYKIISAENEQEVRTVLSNDKVDVIFIALNSQTADGFDFVATLPKDPNYRNIPILAILTYGDLDGVSRAIELGAIEFVTKPFSETILTYRIRNAMAHCQQAIKDAQIKKMNKVIEIDQLTGLYNRETFYKKAAEIIQDNPEVQYCIVYLDINCFKVINDLFHSDTGDLILKTAAVTSLWNTRTEKRCRKNSRTGAGPFPRGGFWTGPCSFYTP